jgi:glycosyltransferase involved in cell wall biosynthesis
MKKTISELPKISVITPSLNQSSYIEETIQSILDQGYPNLEYLIIDGGSTDDTLNIIKKYEHCLSWVSEKDSGQSAAINKGLNLVNGDVVAFLNSDDLYEPGTLMAVGEYFTIHPEADWLTGLCVNIDQSGNEIRQHIRRYKNFWLRWNNYSILKVLNYISQPSTFWKKTAMKRVGYLNEQLHYTMDYDYWLRLGQHYPLHVLYKDLSRFRIHNSSKSGTTTSLQFDEELKVVEQYYTGLPVFLHRVHRALAVKIYESRFR